MKPLIILAGGSSLTLDDIADVTDKQWDLALDISTFPDVPERWERVYTRWSFKHREKCAICQQPKNNWFNAPTIHDVCSDLGCIVEYVKAHEQD